MKRQFEKKERNTKVRCVSISEQWHVTTIIQSIDQITSNNNIPLENHNEILVNKNKKFTHVKQQFIQILISATTQGAAVALCYSFQGMSLLPEMI